MSLVLTEVVAGVVGTLAMDLLNNLVARTGVLLATDVGMIGRMTAGWTRGRFRYRHPGEMEQVTGELLYGYATHYAIGVGLAVLYVLGWEVVIGGPASPAWALVYGVATTGASYFVVYLSVGLRIFGRQSVDGIRAVWPPLANHFFYGVGLAAGVAMM